MANEKDNPIKTEATFDFSEGVDSLKCPTEMSLNNPDGLTRQQLAWLANGTMRDGGISPRDPWVKRAIINLNLPPKIIPGTPQQTIPQPNIPPYPTASSQTVGYFSSFTVPAVGSSVTIPLIAFGIVSNQYLGNVGDVQQVVYSQGTVIGLFLISAIGTNSVTIQNQTASQGNWGAVGQDSALTFNLQVLSPGTPQPPVIIPATPAVTIPVVPFYQGGILYTPPYGTPVMICVIGGHIVQVDPNGILPTVDLSNVWNEYHPVTPRCFFCQGETFLVIQAGDYNPVTMTGTLPLFWDGTTLYRSNGLTGVTVVGTPSPNVYTITLASAWTPNATVGKASTANLTEPYQGNLYDNISIEDSTPSAIGVYRVVAVSGNQVTLETLYISGTPTAKAGAATATLTYPTLSTNTPDNSQTIIIGDGSWTVPSTIGGKVSLTLTSLYFGSVGDTITLYNANGSQNYGSFTVVSFNDSFQIVLQYAALGSPNSTGRAIFGTMLAVVTAVRAFSQSFNANQQQGVGGPFNVTAEGGTTSVALPPFENPWFCKLYDNVQITTKGTSLGYFRVVGLKIVNDQQGQGVPVVTFESIDPNPLYVGQSYPGPLTMTVVIPPSGAGYLVVNAGTWSIPPIGQSIQLQLFWPDSLGPSYPGNVGDIVELLSGANTLAYFMVSAFDLFGDVLLTTFSNSTYTTPVGNIGETFTGEATLTMTIVQVPSTVGENISQIPAAKAMRYYQGLLWYSRYDVWAAGDVVGGPSGTNSPSFTNSILCVTENPLALGGDGFRLPIPGEITGADWPSQINASLGQGLLYIGTINGVCSLQVPVNRQAWIAMNANNLPQINVVTGARRDAPGYGPVNDWCIVSINGDLWFQSNQPSIWSLIQAQRYFQQWGNIDLSDNETRLWNFVNTALMQNISGVYFNKRMLMTSLPQQTPYGIIHTAIVPMDMTPIDTFEELSPPNWEGMHEGLQIFQLLTSGEFNGQQRMFAATLSETNPGEIDLWENDPSPSSYADTFTNAAGETVTTPIQWQFETPAFTWERETELKELVGASLWVDSIVGEVVFKVEWRPDFASCWTFWAEWTECFAQTNAACLRNPTPYPLNLPPGYKPSMDLPRPPDKYQPETGRPAAQGFQFQFRVTITGQGRVRGFAPHCQDRKKNIYEFAVDALKPWLKKLLR